jgi:hypothetical protein
MSVNTVPTLEIRDNSGRLCGTYHYEDPFKSFFRGLYTPSGLNVVACPPPDHPHHKGLQFGLTCSDVNFWEESLSAEPSNCRLAIGRQRTTKLQPLTPTQGNGFLQEVAWEKDGATIFNEARLITVKEAAGAYVWTWRTTLFNATARNVTLISSVWGANGNCGLSIGYCGLGLRLVREIFQNAEVSPAGIQSGAIPPSVSFLGQFAGRGVKVTFAQDTSQKNALFLTQYNAFDPGSFAYLSLGPTNLPPPQTLGPGGKLDATYYVTVADV